MKKSIKIPRKRLPKTTAKTVSAKISDGSYASDALSALKQGNRIFNNVNDFTPASYSRAHNLNFTQLLHENLQLNPDLTDNPAEPCTLQSAIFYTYIFREEIILPFLAEHKIPAIIVKNRPIRPKKELVEEIDPLLTFINPKIDGAYTLFGKFHPKLMLLRFKSFLRVVLPSTNLAKNEWSNVGQNIWLQDFPLKKKATPSEFGNYLESFLSESFQHEFKDKKYFKNLGLNVKKYDFSESKVDLVFSISGRRQDMGAWGIGRVRSLMESYFGKTNPNDSMLIQVSSLGDIKEKFLNDFTRDFLGPFSSSDGLWLLYPTEKYVKECENGLENCGVLYLREQHFKMNKDRFVKLEMKDPKMTKILFHSKFKVIYKKGESEGFTMDKVDEDTCLYFGSHNFGPCPWGSYQKEASQLGMTNFESGFMFNPKKLTVEEKRNILDTLLVNLEADKYGPKDKAWIRKKK